MSFDLEFRDGRRLSLAGRVVLALPSQNDARGAIQHQARRSRQNAKQALLHKTVTKAA